MSSYNIDSNITLNWNGSNFIINGNTSNLYPPPFYITNNNETQYTVTLTFQENINASEVNIIVGSGNLIFDGQNIPISVSVSGYGGLFGSDGSYENVIIQNLIVQPVMGGSLRFNAGWLCQQTVTYFQAINCSSTGAITGGGGGIFGADCDGCTANNCFTSGTITDISGGIFGNGCGACVATNCFSSGSISTSSGGIFGKSSLNCLAINCYSTGSIANGGGIFGSYSNNSTARNCFSVGSISVGAGGIFGPYSNRNQSNLNCNAYGCYSVGTIGGSNSYTSGGIFGAGCNTNASQCTCNATNCFSMGYIYGDNIGASGGIFGQSNFGSCTATNCYSVGNIGPNCGGIFLNAVNSSATNCYSIGTIGSNAGGIFGPSVTSCTATNCYSIGNISDSGGGIFGASVLNTLPLCAAQACYTLGALATTNAGSIYGAGGASPTCTNCYSLNVGEDGSLFGSSCTDVLSVNCITESGETWSDSSAQSTLFTNDNATAWFSAASDTPFLLASFTNNVYLSPPGLQANYIISPDTSNITNNGTIQYTVLNGFYTFPQNRFSQVSTDIYGYNLNNQTIIVTLTGGDVPPFLAQLLAQNKQFNPNML